MRPYRLATNPAFVCKDAIGVGAGMGHPSIRQSTPKGRAEEGLACVCLCPFGTEERETQEVC